MASVPCNEPPFVGNFVGNFVGPFVDRAFADEVCDKANDTIEEFLECFPSVTREMACRLLQRSESVLLTA